LAAAIHAGFDEAVPELTQAGFLELFTELTEVLSGKC